MDSRQLGLFVIVLGVALIVFEYWASYCSLRVDGLCFFPFSPSGVDERFPLYSLAVLAFGLLVYFGSIEPKVKAEVH
ncbi:MAG TPA: hypothetical protein HA254_00955 [Candidatus Diapherotrites archaeon]|uniref:Uncharacterized protein n=1 Tax=Candidatus Iainarchaeum sp. TaxID=3101447 RepID=A0A7J4IUK9_9ARCH|nr:hypothetical protein [Candidatus Diapherotrites archaeon]